MSSIDLGRSLLVGVVCAMTTAACMSDRPPNSSPDDLDAVRGEPSPFDDPFTLAEAQERVDAAYREGVRINEACQELVIDSTREAPRLSVPLTLDFQWGAGHPRLVVSTRFEIGAERTSVERVRYRGEHKPFRQARSISAERTEIATTDVIPIVEVLRAEARTRVEVVTRRVAGESRAMYAGSGDSFRLAQVMGSAEQVHPQFTLSYCGYTRSSSAPDHARLWALFEAVSERLDNGLSWASVPQDALRTTHFGSAFRSSVPEMATFDYRWPLRLSVEALAVFGTPDVLPTLERLRTERGGPPEHHPQLSNLIASPDVYLAGAPKVLPDTLDSAAHSPDAAAPRFGE